MKRTLLIFAAILCVLTACRSNRDRLMEINSFLNDNRLDTAQLCLNHVSPSDLSPYDEALYNLIIVKLNHLSYRPLTSDTLIRSCIDAFTKYDDKERLAESLYYQAVTDYEEGHVPQAFTEMKKAEEIANGIDDLSIRHKIIESLTDWNMSEHQYQLAMTYGKRNLALSTMANNNNWIAYALVFISQIYAGMGQRDSASQYLDKCITYMTDVPDSQRVAFYNYIAAFNIRSNNLATARRYAMKGNSIRPNSMSYATLSQICYLERDGDAVDSLCEKALHLVTTPSEKIYALQQNMILYEAQERYDKAFQTSKTLMEVWDAEAKLREKHNVHNVQATYDSEMQNLQYRQKIICAISALVVAALVIAFILLYYHYNKSQNSKKAIQNQFLINIYSQKIEDLKLSNQNMESIVRSLSKEITWISERQIQIHIEGRKNYDHIMQGGTVARWVKEDYTHFIEYYKLLDQSFVTHLENDYHQLSPRYQFFEILYHIGKDDQEVARIMGISNSTRRAIKTRVKGSVV
ncbi:MAG: hypothetical protein IKX65_01055 [Prevotella sp.]|nr:hypothetical protein [Prevotella sp.]